MIEDMIRQAFSNVWHNITSTLTYYLTFQFVDPFYYWAMWFVALFFVVAAVSWFFDFKWVKAAGGVLILAAAFALYAFGQGEKAARLHDAKKRRRR